VSLPIAVIAVDIANQQDTLPVDRRQIRGAVRRILKEHAVTRATISVAVVDDATIARLHEQFLHDDSPTDVLSFVFESGDGYLEGEVIVSAETAAAAAPRFGSSAANELLLYVIHGTLHLVGHDDRTASQRAEMRRQEHAFLARCVGNLKSEI
jgi:probable rRNA maturation factor